MQSSNEFIEPASSVSYLSESTGHFVSPTVNGIVAISQGFNHQTSIETYIEDSCDSYFDTDTEDISMPGETREIQEDGELYPTSFMTALKKVTTTNNNLNPAKTENTGVDPYHIPSSRYLATMVSTITPQKELKNLIKEVEIASPEYDEAAIDKLTMDVPKIEVLEEPETTYRARYESEGCKGPIHGASENEFPTVKIIGYVGKVTISVFVVTRDNEPHLHSATGPGSSKIPCKSVMLDDNTTRAIEMTMVPTDENDEMIAVFDQLSIRRVRNWEADRELRKRGIDPNSWKSKKKEAKLAFQAKIKPGKYHPGYVFTTYSRSFLCTAPSGNPEIWWASTSESPPEGGEEIGFIGKKFASGFKVRFYSKEDDGHTWETYAEIDRGKSNLNACVVKIPSYKDKNVSENVVVYIEIRVGSEKEPRCSDPYPFTYKPAKIVENCENCTHIKGLLQRIFSGENTDNISGALQNIRKTNSNPLKVQEVRINDYLKETSSNSSNLNSNSSNLNDTLRNNPSSVSLRDLLQLYKINHSDNLKISVNDNKNHIDKVTTPSVVIIPKTNVPPQALYQTENNVVKNIVNVAPSVIFPSHVVPRNLTETMLNVRRDQSMVNTINALPNMIPRLAVSCNTSPSTPQKTYITTDQPVQPAMEITASTVATPSPLMMSVPNSQQYTRQVAINLNPSSLNNFATRLTAPLHNNHHLIDKVKEELVSPSYQAIPIRNQLPITSNTSNNQIVYSPVAVASQVSPNVQQTFTLQQLPQQTVALIQALPTSSSQVLNGDSPACVTMKPLEKEIQMLTSHVQNLKKQLELKRQAVTSSYEYTMIQQGNSFFTSPQADAQQISSNVHTTIQSQLNPPTVVLNQQFKNNNLVIQSVSDNTNNAQHAYTQLKLQQDQDAMAQVKLIQQQQQQQQQQNSFNQQVKIPQGDNNSYTHVKLNQTDTPSYNQQNIIQNIVQFSPQTPNQHKTFELASLNDNQIINAASQQKIPSTQFQPSSQLVSLPSDHFPSSQIQPAYQLYSNTSSNAEQANPKIHETIIQTTVNQVVNNHSFEGHSLQCTEKPNLAIEQQQLQQTYRDINCSLIDSLEKTPGSHNQNELENNNNNNNNNNWDRPLSVNDAIASNKIGFSEECSTRISRPGSPMEVATQENNFLTSLQQLNNGSNNNNISDFTAINNTVAGQLNNETSNIYSNYNSLKQQITSIQTDTSFLDQNISVDYSDSFKKVAPRENNSTSSWVYQDNMEPYGQTVFTNEDSTSQGKYIGYAIL